MAPINFPIERVNEFLKDHSFIIQDPFGDGLNDKMNLTVKVQLTGIKPMISIGEWKDFIEYTLFLEDLDSDFGRGLFGYQFAGLKTNDYQLKNTDTTFYLLTVKVNDILRNFLNYWGVDNYVTCTRVVNHVVKVDPKYITEGLLNEGLLDGITRQIVKDILSVVKYQKVGEFALPEDISDGNMTYVFPKSDTNFTIELKLDTDESVDTVDVDGAYYPDEDVIEVTVLTNPNLDKEILQELHFELNELIRHELEHLYQYEKGDDVPEKEITQPKKYYTQKHELEAQIAGFKRRAQKERKPLEEIIRNWFKRNQLKHRLSPKNVELVINKILELA